VNNALLGILKNKAPTMPPTLLKARYSTMVSTLQHESGQRLDADYVRGLHAFRESPQRFDIVLTDKSMPELAGTAFAGEVAGLRPDVPIALMSGFAGAQLHERARTLGIREVLLNHFSEKTSPNVSRACCQAER